MPLSSTHQVSISHVIITATARQLISSSYIMPAHESNPLIVVYTTGLGVKSYALVLQSREDCAKDHGSPTSRTTESGLYDQDGCHLLGVQDEPTGTGR